MTNKKIPTCRAAGQFIPGQVRHPLEIVMARVAKVRRPEAEEDRDGAAVPTFVLQEIGPVFRTHLRPGDIGAGAADQLGGVVILADFRVASRFAPVIRLVAFVTDVIGVSVHGVGGGVVVEFRAGGYDGFGVVQAFVFQTHQRFPADVLV